MVIKKNYISPIEYADFLIKNSVYEAMKHTLTKDQNEITEPSRKI